MLGCEARWREGEKNVGRTAPESIGGRNACEEHAGTQGCLRQ